LDRGSFYPGRHCDLAVSNRRCLRFGNFKGADASSFVCASAHRVCNVVGASILSLPLELGHMGAGRGTAVGTNPDARLRAVVEFVRDVEDCRAPENFSAVGQRGVCALCRGNLDSIAADANAGDDVKALCLTVSFMVASAAWGDGSVVLLHQHVDSFDITVFAPSNRMTVGQTDLNV